MGTILGGKSRAIFVGYFGRWLPAVLMLATTLAPAAAPCFLGKLPTPADYGRLISEDPYNEMGSDYRLAFGDFLFHHSATPDNMREIAKAAFRVRLALAKKHGTFFARQMEPTRPDGGVAERWLERFDGRTNERCWSFGIPGDARPKEVWDWFNAKLEPAHARLERIDKSIFKGLPGNVPLDDEPVLTWTFRDAPFTFKIYRVTKDAYYLAHLSDADVPAALARVEAAWRRALDPALPDSDRIKAIAELEWLWFWTNPFGRAGAVTGDILSTLLQENLILTGVPVRLRREWKKQDFEVYVRTLSDYLGFRVAELSAPKASGAK